MRRNLDWRTLRRQFMLSIDTIMTKAEYSWVRIARARHGLRSRGQVDRSTGRSPVERLEQQRIGETLWPRIQEAIDRGADVDELAAAFADATTESGRFLADALNRRRAQMLREHRAVHRGMQRRMRALWGPAFDGFYQVYVCAEELGSAVQQLNAGGDDPLVESLLGLHARACLILVEVHALMVRGFPLGAWARTRSLHETAIIATLLSDYGRERGTEDLGERFLAHAAVDQAEDLEFAIRRGAEVDQEVLVEARNQRDKVVEYYGPMFKQNYGWARPLLPELGKKDRVTFKKLEDLADTGLDRFDYRFGGHHVHSSAWSVTLSETVRGETAYRLTGPTNVGFAGPASVALDTTLTCTSAVIHGLAPAPEPMHLVMLQAMRLMT